MSELRFKKFLVREGLDGEYFLILTDAPRKRFKKWIRGYLQELENGKNSWLDPLIKEGYYARALLVSGEGDGGPLQEDLIFAVGYTEEFYLSSFAN